MVYEGGRRGGWNARDERRDPRGFQLSYSTHIEPNFSLFRNVINFRTRSIKHHLHTKTATNLMLQLPPAMSQTNQTTELVPEIRIDRTLFEKSQVCSMASEWRVGEYLKIWNKQNRAEKKNKKRERERETRRASRRIVKRKMNSNRYGRNRHNPVNGLISP